MAAVRCAQCGEELLGAVNRCWRCGAAVLSRPGETSVPPVRRPPVPLPTAERAAVAEEQVLTAELVTDTAPCSAAAPTAAPAVRRVGSPFAPGPDDHCALPPAAAVTAGSPAPHRAAPADTRFCPPYAPPRDALERAASNGAIAGLVLGLISVGVSMVNWSAGGLALVGLMLSLWGLGSPRRRTAMAGLSLCCLALAVIILLGLILWYEETYGFRPWAVPGDS